MNELINKLIATEYFHDNITLSNGNFTLAFNMIEVSAKIIEDVQSIINGMNYKMYTSSVTNSIFLKINNSNSDDNK